VDINIETAMERGRAAFAQGDLAAAEGHFRDALAAGHDDADLHHHLGFIARSRNDLDEAAARYADALEHAPTDAHLHNNLGETRRSQGHLAEAAALFRRGLDLSPDAAPIAANLGSQLLALKRPDLALPILEHAVALDPSLMPVHSDIAICLCSMNRYAESLAVYRRMQEIQPSANDARYLEALALLALGDFDNGWRKHESRWYAHLGQPQRRVVSGPYWLGPSRVDDGDLAGRTILVHAEQGHGDTIQYLRYIPMLRQRAARVIIEVQPALKPMLTGVPDVYIRGEELPPFDANCSFMSLPRAFRTTPGTIPALVPYLTVPPDSLAKWRERIGPPAGRRRIGIAWTGISAVWNRSIPLPVLEPLFERPDCEFHIIQTTMEPEDNATLRRLPHLIDHSTGLADFADTAAVVELMDLIVSVDTALAHLGGALAKPTWTMLPFGAEYRWLTTGTTSAWYPTMRLFRQPELFGWPQVVEAIGSALSANIVSA
jgi:Tfp pilus assembly protein PilF